MNRNSNNIFEFLQERGFIYQSTDMEKAKKLLDGKPTTFYLGVDPTADSLHIGHFFALRMFRFLQEAGHHGILLVGGATAKIGDPSGKSDMRKMMSNDIVADNLNNIKKLVSKFIITEGPNAAEIHSNEEWMDGYDYISFLRDIGTHFNVNQMLTADAYANRIKEGGLTFLEMGYMLIQAYDFVHLKDKYGCRVQIGGSDQWGNIVAGTMLNRKLHTIKSDDDEIYGLTSPLLLTKDGKKMGKTEKGTLWVVGDKTSPFDFYQYFYNIEDASVEMLLKLFTLIDVKDIQDMISKDILKAKRTMAYEITKLVHGEKEADKVVEAVSSLFGNNSSSDNIPQCNYPVNGMKSILLVDLMTEVKFISSKSEARRMIQQNAVCLDDFKISDIGFEIGADKFKAGSSIIIKRGKKNFIKVNFV